MKVTKDREFLLQCATEALRWIGAQDPSFAERIDITRTEYHLDDLQILASYCACVLDRGEHMYFCEREFMQPGYSGSMLPRPCAVCDIEFTPGRTDADVCDKPDCQAAYFAQLDEKFAAGRKG